MPELLEASLKLGLPMVILSWFLFSKLYRDGRLEIAASRKEAEAELKAQRKAAKKATNSTSAKNDALYDKWMWLGGGFYGLAGLWTLFIVEVNDLLRFIGGLPEFIDTFNGGFFELFMMFLMNQFSNLIAAFAWFTYWSDGGFMAWWFLVAYVGYLAGMELAKRKDAMQFLRYLRGIKTKV